MSKITIIAGSGGAAGGAAGGAGNLITNEHHEGLIKLLCKLKVVKYSASLLWMSDGTGHIGISGNRPKNIYTVPKTVQYVNVSMIGGGGGGSGGSNV